METAVASIAKSGSWKIATGIPRLWIFSCSSSSSASLATVSTTRLLLFLVPAVVEAVGGEGLEPPTSSDEDPSPPVLYQLSYPPMRCENAKTPCARGGGVRAGGVLCERHQCGDGQCCEVRIARSKVAKPLDRVKDLKRARADQRERGAISDFFESPIEILEDLVGGDVGQAAEETVRAPVRFVKKFFTLDW